MLKRSLSRRRLLRLARNASGPLALALTMLDKPFSWFFQWGKNAREREQHEWARADRRPAKIVQVGTAREINGAGHLTVSSPTVKGSGTVAPPDPTISI